MAFEKMDVNGNDVITVEDLRGTSHSLLQRMSTGNLTLSNPF